MNREWHPAAPPGWYPDPSPDKWPRFRWWDGAQWTQQFAPLARGQDQPPPSESGRIPAGIWALIAIVAIVAAAPFILFGVCISLLTGTGP